MIDILLGSVAEAVIGDGLENRLGNIATLFKLRKEAAQVAFEIALNRAVETTFKQHSTYSKDLFSEVFLRKPETIDLLRELLQPRPPDISNALATSWVMCPPLPAQDRVPSLTNYILPICKTLAQALHSELQRQSEFFPIFDLQGTEKLGILAEATVAEISRLRAELVQAQSDTQTSLKGIQDILQKSNEALEKIYESLVASSASDYGSIISNFLSHHLGQGEERTPFGGRERELQILTAWLRDPEAPIRFLLTAEMGKGKSTLLVRWIEFLTTTLPLLNLAIVFVPISLMINTANKITFFNTLAIRLAAAFGETIFDKKQKAEDWQAIVHEYLGRTHPQGYSVLVVIDGLDETAGWDADQGFLPVRLSPTFRLVVSARIMAKRNTEGWKQFLGWGKGGMVQSLTLEKLSHEGVKEVLASVPSIAEAEQEALVHELMRLTDGDPLLIGLYIEDLKEQSSRMAFITLPTVAPNLEGYIARWEYEQKKQWKANKITPQVALRRLETLRNLCAVAVGALSAEDIFALTRRRLSGEALKEAAHYLARFIKGDDKGYLFNHSALKIYFYEKLHPNERLDYHRQFIQYGIDTLDKIISGKVLVGTTQSLLYVLPHYITHLRLTHGLALEIGETPPSLATWVAVLHPKWAQAWEHVHQSQQGFNQDVRMVLEHILHTSPHEDTALWLGACWSAVLMYSSVVAINDNLPPDLLAHAIQLNLQTLPQALSVAQQQSDPHQQTKTITAIAPYLTPEHSQLVMALFTQLPNGEQMRLARVLATTSLRNLAHEILSVVTQAPDTLELAWAIEALLRESPATNVFYRQPYLERLWRIAHLQTNDEKLRLLVTLLPFNFKRDEIQTLIQTSLQQTHNVAALVPIVKEALPFWGPKSQKKIITEVEAKIKLIPNDIQQLQAWMQWIPIIIDGSALSLWDFAIQTAVRLLDTILSSEPNRLINNLVLDFITVLPDNFQPARYELANALLPLAMYYHDHKSRIRFQVSLLPFIEAADSLVLFDNLWIETEQLNDPADKVDVLLHLYTYCDSRQKQTLQTAIETLLLQIPRHWERATLIAAFVPYLPPTAQREITLTGLNLARSIGDEREQLHLLCVLIPYLSNKERSQAKAMGLRILPAIITDTAKTAALQLLFSLFTEDEFRYFLPEIHRLIVTGITSDTERVKAILALFSCLTSPYPLDMLMFALSTLEKISVNRLRKDYLLALIPYVVQSEERFLRERLVAVIFAESEPADLVVALIAIVAELRTEVELEELLLRVNTIPIQPYHRVAILISALPQTRGAIRQRLLSDLLTIADHLTTSLELSLYTDTLRTLFPILSVEEKLEFQIHATRRLSLLNTAEEEQPEEEYLEMFFLLVDTLSPSATFLEDPATKIILHLLQAWAQTLSDLLVQIKAFIGLKPYLEKEQGEVWQQRLFEQAIKTNAREQRDALVLLFPFLTSSKRKWAKGYLYTLLESQLPRADWEGTNLLIAFVGQVALEERIEIVNHLLDFLRQSNDKTYQINTLIILLPLLPEETHTFVVNHLHTWHPNLLNERDEEEILPSLLIYLIPYAKTLVNTLLGEILQRLKQGMLEEVPVSTFISLLPHLADLPRQEIRDHIIDIIRNIQQPDFRAEVLITLLPHLTSQERHRAMERVEQALAEMPDEEQQALYLTKFMPHLSWEALHPKLAGILGLSPSLRSEPIRAFAQQVLMCVQADPHLFGSVWAVLLTGLTTYPRPDVLNTLADILPMCMNLIKAADSVRFANVISPDERQSIAADALFHALQKAVNGWR